MHKPNLHQPSVPQRGDEIFDIVDADDRVIGQATRREVHAKGLWHRATHVLMHNSDGKVFLQKRSMLKDSSPGCWDSSCSGHLDTGEDYPAAAVRELREEIGIVTTADRLVQRLRLRPQPDTGWEFVSVFTLQCDDAPSVNPAEIDRGDWFFPDEISAAMRLRPEDFTPAFRLHWAETRGYMEKS
jgi:isopentenyl-diphosphate delta-isomerase type 1